MKITKQHFIDAAKFWLSDIATVLAVVNMMVFGTIIILALFLTCIMLPAALFIKTANVGLTLFATLCTFGAVYYLFILSSYIYWDD